MTPDDARPSGDATTDPTRRPTLRRDPGDRVLGGVCAAIARHLGLDVTLVRLVALVLTIVTGGAALLGYLIAWVVLPQVEGDRPLSAAPARTDPVPDARAAWRSVGGELRSLGAALRPAPPESTPDPAPATAAGSDRRSLAAVDAAMTGLGERLRTPEVQDRARRSVDVLSTAVSASLGGIGRGRKVSDRPGRGTGGAPLS
jgi:phage shock protein PspC (stress-responsive transcriptional regulator)